MGRPESTEKGLLCLILVSTNSETLAPQRRIKSIWRHSWISQDTKKRNEARHGQVDAPNSWKNDKINKPIQDAMSQWRRTDQTNLLGCRKPQEAIPIFTLSLRTIGPKWAQFSRGCKWKTHFYNTVLSVDDFFWIWRMGSSNMTRDRSHGLSQSQSSQTSHEPLVMTSNCTISSGSGLPALSHVHSWPVRSKSGHEWQVVKIHDRSRTIHDQPLTPPVMNAHGSRREGLNR